MAIHLHGYTVFQLQQEQYRVIIVRMPDSVKAKLYVDTWTVTELLP